MTALSANRQTPILDLDRVWRTFGLAADAVIYAGALVARNASGNLVPASASTTISIVGVAKSAANNTGGSAGALEVEVDTCIAKFAKSGTINAGSEGLQLYAADDQTVSLTNGGTAQVTDATLTFNGTDEVGLVIDGILVAVNCVTDAAATIDAWLVKAALYPYLTDNFTFTDGTTKITVAKKTGGSFSIEDHSPATATFALSTVTPGTAPTRPKAGKVHRVESDGVWADLRSHT